jgi:hypothetical protein
MLDNQPSDSLAALEQAISSACRIDVDELDQPGLTRRIDRLHRAQARLAAERARLVAELERRQISDIADLRQRERTRQQIRRDLAGRSNRAPSQTKLDAQAGQVAAAHNATGQAFADGHIDAEHVRLIGEALEAIVDVQRRAEIEEDLLRLARTCRPTVLGRHIRELLARIAPPSVTLREERQHRDRRVSASDTPDGGLSLSGIMYGTAATTVRTALDAFRRPDTPGEHRTPGQRTADALEQLCATALRAGDAPAQHGIRPQVLITVTTDELDRGDDGIAHHGPGEPTTLGRLRHLLADSSWARVVLAPDGTPIEASPGVRTVPKGLWRALLSRDGGCTWAGCDAPAAWCDVAHGQDPFTAGGRLSPDNAALLCRRHHRRFDHGVYRIQIDGDRVTYHRGRDGEPASGPSGPADRQDPRTRSRPQALSSRGRVVLGGPPPARDAATGPPTTTRRKNHQPRAGPRNPAQRHESPMAADP